MSQSFSQRQPRCPFHFIPQEGTVAIHHFPFTARLSGLPPDVLIIDDPFTNIVFGLYFQLQQRMSTHFVQQQKKRREEPAIEAIEARRRGVIPRFSGGVVLNGTRQPLFIGHSQAVLWNLILS